MEIKHKITGAVLFTHEGANLLGADLTGATPLGKETMAMLAHIWSSAAARGFVGVKEGVS